MIRAVLVDDHALIRAGLRRAMERAVDIDPVGEAGSIEEAMAVLRHTKPDVVVVDIRLPDGNGLNLCRTIREQDLARGIVVLSMYGDERRLLGARDAGASMFVSKDAPASVVVDAVRQAHDNPLTFSADGLSDAMKSDATRKDMLTPREHEVLGLLADGLGVTRISSRLFITDSTTKTHVAKIYGKLGAANRAEALMTALRLGLIEHGRDSP